MNRRVLRLALLALALAFASSRPALAATHGDCALPTYASPAEDSRAASSSESAVPAAIVVRAVPRERPAAGVLLTTSDRGLSWNREALETAAGDCPLDAGRSGTWRVRCSGVTWKVEQIGSGVGAKGYVFARS
jgi:hypothetical protein